MSPVYETYPAVDENNNFPPPIRLALAASPEISNFLLSDELVFSALRLGVTNDGVTDVTVALNAAAAEVYSKNPDAILFIPRGNYKISGPVTIRCQLEATQATFRYTGTGTALILGYEASKSVVTPRRRFNCPRVIKVDRTTGWDGTSVGIKAVNLNTCEIYTPFIQDFERGLVMYGYGGGNAYNTVNLGALWENHKNLVLDCTSDGYTNQNLFLGGRLQHSLTKGAVLDDINASQIYMVAENPEGGPNNNTFLNVSFEGENVAFYRVEMSGAYNQIINGRWEAPAGVNPRVRYRTNALRNRISGGYGSPGIIETFDGTLGGGSIDDTQGAYMAANTTLPAQVIPNDVTTTIKSFGPPVSRRIDYNSATGEFTPRPGRWLIGATVHYAINATGRRISSIVAAGSTICVDEKPGYQSRLGSQMVAPFRFNGQQSFVINTRQTSGSDVTLEGSSGYVRVWAEYLGV
ncbi:tail protein [Arthrobacter phage Correa]|uniref:Rhamnogalacturonase A/B/Epimerase-like pectate lyase domain-containing protein n=1 Tax=Arthrobacter phage Correa TaxID=2024275 RepID=A0A222Z6E4_9CAUD|nr:tail protein [Arthrobacter phage Correa]ASR80079.1 hypothetical protein SEA_CORREA_18 [Arthrobacter phage Correa]